MRKHFNLYITTVIATLMVCLGSMQVFAAGQAQNNIETITIDENLERENSVQADISWKTKQDKGQWIEDLGIAGDAKSLILVINNLDKEDANAIPNADAGLDEELRKSIAKIHRLDGKSKLSYFSKGTEGEWSEVYSVECFISGGMMHKNTDIYGVYEPVSTFGLIKNPGSLLPYRILGSDDYWSVNPESETYGEIFTPEKAYIKPEMAVNLRGLKSYSNYSLILHPEEAYASCPPLVVNCMQLESNNDLLSGIQMPEDHLRMMIQSIDKATKVVIAGSLDELEEMQGYLEEMQWNSAEGE